MSDEKDDLISKLRYKEPSAMQLHKWNTAVQFEAAIYKKKFSWFHIMQLATAGFCGLLAGALIFGNFTGESIESNDFASDNATIEVIYAKL